ncbi:MAG: hypothetical protein SOW23_09030, partial [Eubacteriales bacterium]|nr:hypothetical protein [Eubacteriales bacterium]
RWSWGTSMSTHSISIACRCSVSLFSIFITCSHYIKKGRFVRPFLTGCGQRRRALALNYLQKRLKTKSIKKKNRLHAQPVL